MKNDLFSEDAFFRFDLEESATIEAVIVGSGAVAIFLYACHGNVITSKNGEPLVTKRSVGHLNTDDFSILWDEDDLKLNSYQIMDEIEWKVEILKYELWPQCLDGLIKAYQVASVILT
jgi:hypothetical protein